MSRLVLSVLLLSLSAFALADAPQLTPREALRTHFQDLVGPWRGTGTLPGSSADVQKNFWSETLDWQWQFKGQDAWLAVRFDKSKNFASGELRYLPSAASYQLALRTPDKQTITFQGNLAERVLTLEREDPDSKETQRLVFNFLHPNRFLYRYEVRAAGKGTFRRVYQVGATKEGVPFAAGDGRPECVVSGGLGTIPVTYEGRTFYVCCSGCRDEFNADPGRYVKEFEARKSKKTGGSNP